MIRFPRRPARAATAAAGVGTVDRRAAALRRGAPGGPPAYLSPGGPSRVRSPGSDPRACRRWSPPARSGRGLDLEARLRLAERGRAGFAGRYRYEEQLRTPIADRLRQERGALARLLAAPEEVPEPLLRRSASLVGIVKELRTRESQGRLRPPISEILTSYVHMFVNRMSRSAGPEHELVLYDFLVQLYGSQLARERKAAATPRKAVG